MSYLFYFKIIEFNSEYKFLEVLITTKNRVRITIKMYGGGYPGQGYPGGGYPGGGGGYPGGGYPGGGNPMM